MNRSLPVERASEEDAAEILDLQKLAYLSEAQIVDDFSIPPLKQTYEQILSEFKSHVVLKVRSGDPIIASVRVCREGDTVCIGKLIVHPDHQGQGIGSMLLRAAEDLFPNVRRYELFTGHKSERNLHLYHKYGYKPFRSVILSGNLTIVFLEKSGSVP
jgi:GNAT superfamily N-acetyltransferase